MSHLQGVGEVVPEAIYHRVAGLLALVFMYVGTNKRNGRTSNALPKSGSRLQNEESQM
jgi:hypothetical protein